MEITWKIVSNTGTPITGGAASTVLKLRRVLDGFLYDWNDDTFKASGWGAVSTTLTEVDGTNLAGVYAKSVNVTGFNDGVYQAFADFTASTPNLFAAIEWNLIDGKIAVEGIDASLDALSLDVATVDGNVDDIETLLTTVDGKVDTIDTVVDRIEVDTTSIESKVDTVDTVVDRIENDTTSIDGKIDTVDTVVDGIAVDLTALDNKVDVLIAGAGLYAITITLYETATVTPIANAWVTAYKSTDLMARGQTDALGQVVLALDAGAYVLRLSKPGVVFSAESLTVTGDASETYYGDSVVIPQPEDAESCTLYEYCYDQASNEPLAEITASAKISTLPSDYYGRLHHRMSYEGSYDADTGLWSIEIVRGAVVTVTILEVGVNDTITIPDQATARLADLL